MAQQDFSDPSQNTKGGDKPDPMSILQNIQDQLDQLKTALGGEETSEGESDTSDTTTPAPPPMTDEEIMAGIKKPPTGPPMFGGR